MTKCCSTQAAGGGGQTRQIETGGARERDGLISLISPMPTASQEETREKAEGWVHGRGLARVRKSASAARSV